MRRWIVVVAMCGLGGCSSEARPSEKPAATSERAPATSAREAAGTGAEAKAENAASEPDAGVDAAVGEAPADAGGWVQESRENQVPICVFASYQEREKAKFIQQVKKQTLRANTEIIIGAFAPRCMSQECEARPTLQCWVDQEADGTLVVQTRFYTERKPDKVCKTNCEPVIAGCPTPELPPGTYTLRYGERTQKLRVPGTLSKPCLPLK